MWRLGPGTLLLLLGLGAVFCVCAAADDRPTEDELFTAPAQPPSQTTASAGPAGTAQLGGSAGSASAANAHTPESVSSEPVLSLGGQIYLRTQVVALEGQEIEDYSFSVPTLLDVYLDARPNDRVRGFVLWRMSYDPMLPDTLAGVPSVGTTASDNGTSGTAALSSLFGTQTNTPRILLDQLWLRFDVWRALFITAGRQHVRWGTSRFWTPADLLHLQRRNPLDVFDARRGTDMLKLHLPIESIAWNFYVYAVAGGHNDTPTLYSVSAAARAEFVLGSFELGLGALVRRGAQPKFAADLSMGLGIFDLYAEGALVDSAEIDRVSYLPGAQLPDPLPMSGSAADVVLARIRQAVDAYYPAYRTSGYRGQVVVGLNYTQRYADSDSFTLGLEYFANGLGYDEPTIYPGLVFPRTQALQDSARFFYLGRQYGAVYLAFPAPFALDLHTFVLSGLCNISDRSCIARVDYSVQILTHLRLEAYVAGVFGRRNGEFTFGIETPSIDGIRLGRQPSVWNAGIALRIGI